MSGSGASGVWAQSRPAAETASFALPVPAGAAARLARGWLLLGVGALLLSGLFSVLIVLARAPGVSERLPWVDLFHTALVVHVDLSVLVWFLAFAGVFWSLHGGGRAAGLGRVALVLAVAGTLGMAAAPFLGAGRPLMSNYIPVLDDPLFLGALLLFAAGCVAQLARALLFVPPVGVVASGEGALRFGVNTAAVAGGMSVLAFVWSWLLLPDFLEGKERYEQLFWGGGHVLQYVHTQLMLVAWLWLAHAGGLRSPITPRVVLVLFAWGLLTVFATPLVYLAYPFGSVPHLRAFTWMMAFGGSLAAAPIGAAVLAGLLGRPRAAGGDPVARMALWASVTLFGVGGVLGFAIEGGDVRVPAHYHGSIVGITLAFMGLAYHLMPRLGLGVPPVRLARWQLGLYAAGQLLHVLGLAWSGGYGVPRKTPGAAQGLEGLPEIAGMAVMGLGGLLAIVGGMLFVVAAGLALARRR